MKSKASVPPLSVPRILKIGTCPTLSGKSVLTYHIGCNEAAEVQFRVYANAGGGFFSNEWVSATAIQRALSKTELVTAVSLHPVFRGKSANSAGFLLAVLKHEGLIGRSEANPRCYVRTESEAFVAEVKALMESSVNLDPDAKPEVAGKKAEKPVKGVAAPPVATKVKKTKKDTT